MWMRKFFQLGRPLVEEVTGTALAPEVLEPSPALGVDDLYNLRRDAEGVPYDHAARRKEPSPGAAPSGERAPSLVERERNLQRPLVRTGRSSHQGCTGSWSEPIRAAGTVF